MDQIVNRMEPPVERATRAPGKRPTPRVIDIDSNNSGLRCLTYWVRCSSDAIALLDASGVPLYVNEAATEIGERYDALQIGSQWLRAQRASNDVILQRLIVTAIEAASPAAAVGAMRLTRAVDGRDYLLQVTRREDEQPGPAAKRIVVCVAIWDPERATAFNGALLRDLFRVTPAELRLLEQLMRGRIAEQAAVVLVIAITTTRYHLARIYQARRRQAGNTGRCEPGWRRCRLRCARCRCVAHRAEAVRRHRGRRGLAARVRRAVDRGCCRGARIVGRDGQPSLGGRQGVG